MAKNKTAFAAGAIFALVLSGGTAVAATGGSFILGKSNTAGSTTTLTNQRGTALALNSKAGTPPLKVSSGAKVARLHADKLDGKDATAFALRTGRTGVIEAPGVVSPEAGLEDYVLAMAECPAGTILTGGGMADFTDTGITVVDAPADGRTWFVAVLVDRATETQAADAVSASAVCYNPRGSVPGDVSGTSFRSADQDDRLSSVAKRMLD